MKTYHYKPRRTEQRLDRGEEEQKGRSPEIPCSQNCLCRHLAVNSREVGSEGSPPPQDLENILPSHQFRAMAGVCVPDHTQQGLHVR